MTIDLWIEPITRSWPLLLGILGAVGAWWKLHSQVQVIGREVVEMDARMKLAEARSAEQDVRLARGDVMLTNIANRLTRIEDKLDRAIERKSEGAGN